MHVCVCACVFVYQLRSSIVVGCHNGNELTANMAGAANESKMVTMQFMSPIFSTASCSVLAIKNAIITYVKEAARAHCIALQIHIYVYISDLYIFHLT